MTFFENRKLLIDRLRRCGKSFVLKDRKSLDNLNSMQILDEFAERNGLNKIGESWHQISQDLAISLASWMICHDMAYSMKLLDETVAIELAKEFIAQFSKQLQFFTNLQIEGNVCNFASPNDYNFMPLTNSTFDSGIAIIDETSVGLLWFADED